MNSQQIENARLKVVYYGRWTYYGGGMVFFVSLMTFLVEFARLVHISKYHKHDSSWVVEDDHAPAKTQLDKITKLLINDPENEKAIQMGNKESLIFIYYLNCAICILFGIIGIVMHNAAKPALQMCSHLQLGLAAVPKEL